MVPGSTISSGGGLLINHSHRYFPTSIIFYWLSSIAPPISVKICARLRSSTVRPTPSYPSIIRCTALSPSRGSRSLFIGDTGSGWSTSIYSSTGTITRWGVVGFNPILFTPGGTKRRASASLNDWEFVCESRFSSSCI